MKYGISFVSYIVKAGFMKTHTTQTEILIMTGTTFEQKRLQRIDKDHGHITLKKQMRKIFDQTYWSSVLPAILPEIVEKTSTNKTTISFIRKGHSFIQLEMSEEPLIIEREYSLDPYLFLSSEIYN